MHLSLKTVAIALLFCASCASTPEAPQAPEPAAEGAAEEPELAPEVAAAIDAAQAGPEHELLAKLAGDWTIQFKMWMAPNTPPITPTAQATNEMVLGGRFLQTHSTGEMKIGDMSIPVDSIGMMGFDRRNGVYTSVGFDTMGTYYVTAAGPRDPETGVITMSGSDHDQRTDITQTYKFVMRVIDDDHYVIDLYFTNFEMTHGQDEFHLVEMSYSRN
jgi:uncharacterized protein DUF1579